VVVLLLDGCRGPKENWSAVWLNTGQTNKSRSSVFITIFLDYFAGRIDRIHLGQREEVGDDCFLVSR
jgi:hypothetical protein